MPHQRVRALSRKDLGLVFISTILFFSGSVFIGRLDGDQLPSPGVIIVALLFFTLLSINLIFFLYRSLSRPPEQLADTSHLNSWIDKGSLTALGQTMVSLNARFGQRLCLFIAEIDDDATQLGSQPEIQSLLATISSKFTESLRETDVVGRHEDKSFLIILPNTSKDEGYRLAEKIRVNLYGSIVLGRTVSLSIGCVEARKNETYEHIMERAESSLLCAKQGGRNQTVVD